MKVIFLILSAFIYAEEVQLLDQYHSYSDLRVQLLEWDQEFGEQSNYLESPNPYYPNIGLFYELDTLGYSSNLGLPIWVVKLSSNINSLSNQDKPKILILGQCHAEEIYGVEIAMGIINMLLHPQDYDIAYRPTVNQINPYTHLREALAETEIWVIPTHNPEGLQVVYGEYIENGEVIHDVSFRKNITDTNGNGVLDYQNYSSHNMYAGGEIDGVDLNRNFDFNWMFGDELDQLDGGCYSDVTPGQHYFSHYDYYKGHQPFSESEVDLIKDIALENDFIFSIAYHSSRSGCISERVVYSWKWRDQVTGVDTDKSSPDIQEIENIGFDLATILDYEATVSKSMKGNAHDWFYAKTGTIQYLIEAGQGGQEGMQTSDVAYLNQTIKDNILAAFYLINRAAGNSSGDNSVIRPEKTMLTGIIQDSITGQVIEKASVTVLELNGPMLENRDTDSHGRFRRIVGPGNYNLDIEADGYESKSVNVDVSIASINQLDIELNPKIQHSLWLSINGAESADVYIENELGQIQNMIMFSGSNEIQLFSGTYVFWLLSEGKNPSFFEVMMSEDRFISVDIMSENKIFSESFNDLTGWSYSSEFLIDGNLKSQDGLVYSNNSSSSITSLDSFQSSSSFIIFEINGGYETEWENDFITIDLIGPDSSIHVNSFSGHEWREGSHKFSINVEETTDYFVKITLVSDESIVYRGINFNSIFVYDGVSAVDLSVLDSSPISYELFENYPNPFNPSTKISFYLDKSEKISMEIYNLNGKLVDVLIDSKFFSAGMHDVVYKPKGLSSGNYYYSLKTEDQVLVKKLTYIK